MIPPRPLRPLFSVVTPVLGEAGRINDLVDHIRMSGYGLALEIIVVDGDPASSTLAALSREGVLGLTAPRGRASQLNAGAAAARGENLLFLHADTRLPAGAFQAAAAALDGPADAGAFSLAIRSKNPLLACIAAGATLRSRLFSLPYGDQAQFVRRDLFNAMGGFPAIPLMEDVALMRTIVRAGGRVVILPLRATTSARRWRAEGILKTTARNLALITLYSLGVAPARLARLYPAMPDLARRGRG
ncbi:glycosyl transferase family 2 [Solidesulfovibrio carbinoliphilus subsp. oakridgensis]|uniref:Glycosyl transferase family 2 n=1 Tax=Solidesulfovibrio carbinoliphilus subsp. oakridgensis TaxID=694327 RepID=G7Q919_9BACT|nr:TIGR04283 family arsenosugar biosynthesis glycosyltransferase [Solidesulfovibrio carbinoliphilus]EHJ47741.1 glycosyl transferase family 2 [Solidesulfovibrio carbinoliphilus subsp. oakridgensis]